MRKNHLRLFAFSVFGLLICMSLSCISQTNESSILKFKTADSSLVLLYPNPIEIRSDLCGKVQIETNRKIQFHYAKDSCLFFITSFDSDSSIIINVKQNGEIIYSITPNFTKSDIVQLHYYDKDSIEILPDSSKSYYHFMTLKKLKRVQYLDINFPVSWRSNAPVLGYDMELFTSISSG